MRPLKKICAALLAAVTALTALHIGTLTTQADTFFDEGDFRYAVTSGERLWVAKYLGDSSEVELPQTLGGRAVVGVYSRCFENTAVVSVTIPEGCTSVGSFAFSGCADLQSVDLPSTLKNIGIMAFNGCETLESVDLANTSLEAIGFAAFNNCSSLKAAELPGTLASIGENAFCNCTSLQSLTLPQELATVPEYAFYNTALTDIVLPASVTALEEGCFGGNPALTRVFLPETVESIGSAAFDGSTAIYCFENSPAAEYCAEKGLENAKVFASVVGDANLDGRLNINDVTAIQRHLAEYERLWQPELLLADSDGDGEITVEDATRIRMILAEFGI